MILTVVFSILYPIQHVSSKNKILSNFRRFFCLHFHSINLLSVAAYLEPLIKPLSEDVTHLPGDNVTFTCESDEPIHWRFAWLPYLNEAKPLLHENTINKMKRFKHDFSHLNNKSNENSYQIQLVLFNVSHASVGYYFCVKNSSERLSNFETLLSSSMISKIYLFVKGEH